MVEPNRFLKVAYWDFVFAHIQLKNIVPMTFVKLMRIKLFLIRSFCCQNFKLYFPFIYWCFSLLAFINLFLFFEWHILLNVETKCFFFLVFVFNRNLSICICFMIDIYWLMLIFKVYFTYAFMTVYNSCNIFFIALQNNISIDIAKVKSFDTNWC